MTVLWSHTGAAVKLSLFQDDLMTEHHEGKMSDGSSLRSLETCKMLTIMLSKLKFTNKYQNQ